jgi:uncharacterized membrane protein YbaN (DUF454 family)
MHGTNSMIRAAAALRRPVGFALLAVALLGFALPIIPGWPFIIPAILLLGRRDRALRRTHLALRRALRSMRRSEREWLRQAGLRCSAEYLKAKRAITPAIRAAERTLRMG